MIHRTRRIIVQNTSKITTYLEAVPPDYSLWMKQAVVVRVVV